MLWLSHDIQYSISMRSNLLFIFTWKVVTLMNIACKNIPRTYHTRVGIFLFVVEVVRFYCVLSPVSSLLTREHYMSWSETFKAVLLFLGKKYSIITTINKITSIRLVSKKGAKKKSANMKIDECKTCSDMFKTGSTYGSIQIVYAILMQKIAT